MKGFERLHVNSAVKAHSPISLSSDHLTTLQIGQIVPLYCTEVIPGDKFHVKANYFSRMAPLVKPTYGKFDFKTVSVFVPYHQLAYDFEAFRVGKNTWEGITPNQRYITYGEFIGFLNNGYVSSNGSSADYSFSYVNASGVLTYKKFTEFGKYCIKVLNSLGYTIPQNVDLQTTSTWYSKFYATNISAMPILAFAKAYNDYMSQSQRFNTSVLTNFLRCVKLNVTVSGYNISTHVISATGLVTILGAIVLCYDNDYFTSAWQNANTPLNSPENIGLMPVPESTGGITATTADTITSIQSSQVQTNLWSGPLGQRALDFLKSFDDWVRRNNYSGSRDVQQIYSRFGIKVDDYRSHYSHVITTDSMNMQVGDVTATTVGTNQALGDYAGKAIISGSKGFKFDSSDFGMLMILGYITVKPMYAYGFDRSVLRVDALDYYTPEFDGLGADAISYGEVYTDPKNQNASDTSLDDAVFGFTERYNSYRFGRDKITGDFRRYENSAPENNWHCGRLLTAVRGAGTMVAQSSSMNTLPQHTSEFSRIFSVTSGVDQFYMTCQFDVKAIRPIMSLNQVPRLGEGSVDVPRNGNEIN